MILLKLPPISANLIPEGHSEEGEATPSDALKLLAIGLALTQAARRGCGTERQRSEFDRVVLGADVPPDSALVLYWARYWARDRVYGMIGHDRDGYRGRGHLRPLP